MLYYGRKLFTIYCNNFLISYTSCIINEIELKIQNITPHCKKNKHRYDVIVMFMTSHMSCVKWTDKSEHKKNDNLLVCLEFWVPFISIYGISYLNWIVGAL